MSVEGGDWYETVDVAIGSEVPLLADADGTKAVHDPNKKEAADRFRRLLED